MSLPRDSTGCPRSSMTTGRLAWASSSAANSPAGPLHQKSYLTLHSFDTLTRGLGAIYTWLLCLPRVVHDMASAVVTARKPGLNNFLQECLLSRFSDGVLLFCMLLLCIAYMLELTWPSVLLHKGQV